MVLSWQALWVVEVGVGVGVACYPQVRVETIETIVMDQSGVVGAGVLEF